jgi:hypothetical protein
MSKTDALLKAGPVRLRPILMTALSTIAGMIPVAIGLGAGAETRAPMGTAIVGGMITSTILTLVVIPVVYSVMDDLAGLLRRLVFGSEAAAMAVRPQLPEATIAIAATTDTAVLWRDDCREDLPSSGSGTRQRARDVEPSHP